MWIWNNLLEYREIVIASAERLIAILHRWRK
jgi:hypothetical protein